MKMHSLLSSLSLILLVNTVIASNPGSLSDVFREAAKLNRISDNEKYYDLSLLPIGKTNPSYLKAKRYMELFHYCTAAEKFNHKPWFCFGKELRLCSARTFKLCQNGGYCTGSRDACTCPPAFIGKDCETPKCTGSSVVNFQGNCVAPVSGIEGTPWSG
eukprot:scpid99324/ scgid4926/ 